MDQAENYELRRTLEELVEETTVDETIVGSQQRWHWVLHKILYNRNKPEYHKPQFINLSLHCLFQQDEVLTCP